MCRVKPAHEELTRWGLSPTAASWRAGSGLPLPPAGFCDITPRGIISGTLIPVGAQEAVWGSEYSGVQRQQTQRHHPHPNTNSQDTLTSPAGCGPLPEVSASVPLTGGPPVRTPGGQPKAEAGSRTAPARSPGRPAVTDLGFRAWTLRTGPTPPALRSDWLRRGGLAAEAPAQASGEH